MKELNLVDYNVSELTTSEMLEIDGGLLGWVAISWLLGATSIFPVIGIVSLLGSAALLLSSSLLLATGCCGSSQ